LRGTCKQLFWIAISHNGYFASRSQHVAVYSIIESLFPVISACPSTLFWPGANCKELSQKNQQILYPNNKANPEYDCISAFVNPY